MMQATILKALRLLKLVAQQLPLEPLQEPLPQIGHKHRLQQPQYRLQMKHRLLQPKRKPIQQQISPHRP